ncbi:hypothetical protein BREV_BREV_03410 [Brevundimonas mediterranea]|uniref:Secreted protein n=1 Tax=Brevundimonas mediterranea TaxID=74329 RepID=A0A7Z8Y179_9CAUL|nr:hypothetical protein BREV_BREV_03410 [Brevundimonas mediterranea]
MLISRLASTAAIITICPVLASASAAARFFSAAASILSAAALMAVSRAVNWVRKSVMPPWAATGSLAASSTIRAAAAI